MDLAANRRNAGVLAYLTRRSPASLAYQSPGDVANPWMGSGSHPDIVERVWKVLGASIPAECRAIVHGTPALVDPATGLVLAVAIGTQYALRLRATDVAAAVARGAPTATKWSGGETLDVRETFGEEWILGSWKGDEATWVAALHASPGDEG